MNCGCVRVGRSEPRAPCRSGGRGHRERDGGRRVKHGGERELGRVGDSDRFPGHPVADPEAPGEEPRAGHHPAEQRAPLPLQPPCPLDALPGRGAQLHRARPRRRISGLQDAGHW